MPRVHTVQKARKADPRFGIAVGDKYHYWEFRNGGVRKSKTYPTRSQLTMSNFLGQLYTLFDDTVANASDPGDFEAAAESLRELGQECEESKSNMPEGLQEGPTGELLQERADGCEQAAEELERIGTELQEKLDAIEALAEIKKRYDEAQAELDDADAEEVDAFTEARDEIAGEWTGDEDIDSWDEESAKNEALEAARSEAADAESF